MMNIVFLCQEYKKNAEQFFSGTISDADKQTKQKAGEAYVVITEIKMIATIWQTSERVSFFMEEKDAEAGIQYM
jgi:type IV secretory pathway component VirB8